MFGFGANLNIHHLQEKKQLKVLDYGAAKVDDFYIAFPKGGFAHVEPAFASAWPKKGEEIQGLAYAVSKEDLDKCNQMEKGYGTTMTTLHLYDGRNV